MIGPNAHFAQLGKALLDAAFHHVLEMNDAEHFAPLATTSGVPPEREISSIVFSVALAIFVVT